MLKLPKLTTYISPYLGRVDERIRFAVSPNYISKITQNIAFGGKRVRPIIMILLSNLLGGAAKERFLSAAASIELIHLASLLHDDVIDENSERHNKNAAHILFGNQRTILGGDYLFATSFKTMVEAGSFEALDVISSASCTLSIGELEQLENKSNIKTTQAKYYDVIYKKTASLFEAGCEIAAIIQGKNRDGAKEFGKAIGMAFQVIDDLLDYTGSLASMGKAIGTDFAEKKITLPVILALSSEKIAAFEKRKMEELFLSGTEFDEFFALLKKSGAFEEAKKIASGFCNEAKDILKKISTDSCIEVELILDVISFFENRIF